MKKTFDIPGQLNIFDLLDDILLQGRLLNVCDLDIISEKDFWNVIRTGGGKNESRKRIYAKYMAGYTAEEMMAFLKSEIGTTAKGFVFGGEQTSILYNDDGLYISRGLSMLTDSSHFYPWEDVEKAYFTLIHNGSFMDENEACDILDYECLRIAESIYFFYVDGAETHPSFFKDAPYGFPERTKIIKDMLKTKEGRVELRYDLSKQDFDIKSGKLKIRWKYVKRPDFLLREIDDIEHMEFKFPLSDNVSVIPISFITQDEIDAFLFGNGNRESYKLKLAKKILENRDKAPSVIKDYYGISGGSPALMRSEDSSYSADGKGLCLSKGPFLEPSATILLSWNAVAKRMLVLLDNGVYDELISECGNLVA